MIEQDEILSAKILIVDDQMLYIRLLEEILKSEGYRNIYSTTNPRDVVVMYQDIDPDLMLLDLMMPNVDGFQIMKELGEVKTDEFLPILVLSGIIGQEVRLRALQVGATDFLNKPYETVEVLMRIRNMIETRLLHKKVRDYNKILEQKVSERTRELRATQLDIIRRLAHAAEYRDTDTGDHIIRMSYYCARLAREVGMSEKECDLIFNASPLHDIGKIGIPDSILLKPGKLTPEEWGIMKTHTTIGAELLSGSNSEVMTMAQEIALTHQEKWDGSGYPKGLKGDEIPLAGRICAVCDVFDALTTDRPYKRAWSVDDAVTEIKNQSGKHFDPHLVDCFVNILPDIIAIKQENQGQSD